MVSLSSVLHFGPGKLISEFDGGSNFFYLGSLTKEIREGWDFPEKTCSSCASSSISRLEELPPGKFKTDCLIRALVRAVDTNKWDQVNWVVPQLPSDYALYSENLLVSVLKTGVMSAIRFAMPMEEKGISRAIFRVASKEAVRKGHHDAARFMYTHFENDWHLRNGIVVEACCKGDTSLVEWLVHTTYSWPSEGTYALLYGGHVESLEYVKSIVGEKYLFDSGKVVLYAALGGHLETLEWVFENSPVNPVNTMDDRELCLMVSSKGHVDILRYLVCTKGFRFNKTDCLRFAKKGSGIQEWLERT